jgi:hypothetical protein
MNNTLYPQVCSGQITKNFAVWEVANKKAPEAIKLILSPGLYFHYSLLQKLRDWYGKPMNVTSGYRSPKFNANLPSANKNSSHLRGMATDVSLPGLTEEQYKNFAQKWREICDVAGVIGGVTYYNWGIHFDCDSDIAFGSKSFRVDDCRK